MPPHFPERSCIDFQSIRGKFRVIPTVHNVIHRQFLENPNFLCLFHRVRRSPRWKTEIRSFALLPEARLSRAKKIFPASFFPGEKILMIPSPSRRSAKNRQGPPPLDFSGGGPWPCSVGKRHRGHGVQVQVRNAALPVAIVPGAADHGGVVRAEDGRRQEHARAEALAGLVCAGAQ